LDELRAPVEVSRVIAISGASRLARGSFVLAVLALSFFALACGATAVSEESPSTASDAAVSLEPTFDSPEALARAFLSALENEDGPALKSYALTEEQFRHYVWPQLPSSRPERNVPFELGWGDLHQKSHNALLHTFAKHKGKTLELVEIRFEDGMTDYGDYVVHRDARVKVRREDGEEAWMDLFGSVMEWNGRYKLFSYVTD
jgi:hypothetical protein